MSAKNNIYTKGYFKKRLKEIGYMVHDSNVKFDNANGDARYWTLIVETKGKHNVVITCNKADNNFWFLFTIGDRTFEVRTLSMSVIIGLLTDLGISSK